MRVSNPRNKKARSCAASAEVPLGQLPVPRSTLDPSLCPRNRDLLERRVDIRPFGDDVLLALEVVRHAATDGDDHTSEVGHSTDGSCSIVILPHLCRVGMR